MSFTGPAGRLLPIANKRKRTTAKKTFLIILNIIYPSKKYIVPVATLASYFEWEVSIPPTH